MREAILNLQKLKARVGRSVMSTLNQLRIIEASVEIPNLVEQYLIHCSQSLKLSPKTMKTRASHMKFFLQFCRAAGVTSIRDVNLLVLDTFLQQYQEGRAVSTVNTARRVYKTFFNWVRDYKEMDTVNSTTIRLVREPRKRPRAMNMDIVKQVIRGCRNVQDTLMICVFIEAGLRIEELSVLKVGDISNDSINVTGKGAMDRRVYISENLAGRIEMFTEYRHCDDPLFVTDNKGGMRPMSTNTIRRRVQRWFMEIANIEMQPHQLRHTYAVNLLENGCDLITIQKLLGHKDVTTTQSYLLLSDDHLRFNYKRFSTSVYEEK